MRNSTTRPSSDETSQTTRLISRITSVKVGGFKAISQVKDIEIGSLTILAGANSSGKSSALQPLLILKQTIDDHLGGSDLVLAAGHTDFTDKEQILSKSSENGDPYPLTIGLTVKDYSMRQTYRSVNSNPLAIAAILYSSPHFHPDGLALAPEMTSEDIKRAIDNWFRQSPESFRPPNLRPKVDSGILSVAMDTTEDSANLKIIGTDEPAAVAMSFPFPFITALSRVLHVKGVRGLGRQPRFTPPRGDLFPGPIELYAASLLLKWQEDRDARLDQLRAQLAKLALTASISAKSINDSTAEISVGRSLAHPDELVSIADVGFGVSQVLPVLLALLAAEPGRLVYIEQPEVHLHPNAQVALAQIICEAVQKGIQVVMETHSELMLLAVQTAVAKQELDPSQVVLHWFSQSKETGETQIDSRKPEPDGSFGDWPVDFSAVTMDAQLAYLRSVHAIAD